MRISVEPTFSTDSLEYELLKKAVHDTKEVEGFTCEIGVRGGGGSMHMIDALIETGQQKDKIHVAVDPFGNIEYEANDVDVIRQDYTNDMRDDFLLNMYVFLTLLGDNKVNLLFFNLEDTEFFKRYSDGIPLYNETKRILNKYSVVHLDGPHSKKVLLPEIAFFHERTDKGAMIVFDDTDLYDHEFIHKHMLKLKWKRVSKGERKQVYTKS
jgi:Methyltransferase domain